MTWTMYWDWLWKDAQVRAIGLVVVLLIFGFYYLLTALKAKEKP